MTSQCVLLRTRPLPVQETDSEDRALVEGRTNGGGENGMTESNALHDQDEPPEDVASLYSWANLQGAKYRDFSAARAQTRENARLRMQQAQEAEKQRLAANAAKSEAQIRFEHPRRADVVRPYGVSSLADQVEVLHEKKAKRDSGSSVAERPRTDWMTEVKTAAVATTPPVIAEEKPQERWFLLRDVLEAAPKASAPVHTVAPVAMQTPVLALFSLAGGVGKTSLTATLGRTLAASGERVLLVDTSSYGLLPFYFGAEDQRPGQVRTFMSPHAGVDAPVQVVSLDPEAMGAPVGEQEPLCAAIQQYAHGVDRVIVDLATASGATTRRVLRLAPTVLVPLTPDMNSVASVQAIEEFFRRQENLVGGAIRPYYVLNQFDATLPLHVDVRRSLAQQLGDRLLDFSLRRTPEVSEALAEGMTVVDYAPQSAVTGDFDHLAGWVKTQSAPANPRFRGVRWSER